MFVKNAASIQYTWLRGRFQDDDSIKPFIIAYHNAVALKSVASKVFAPAKLKATF